MLDHPQLLTLTPRRLTARLAARGFADAKFRCLEVSRRLKTASPHQFFLRVAYTEARDCFCG